ncbi:MAG: hypothetical protein QXM27_02815 [Candidatus Pacearchaeota archaeon]
MCENTNCENEKQEKLYKVILKEEFNNDVCIWCEDCLNRDIDMVKSYKLLKNFGVKNEY